MSAQTSVSEWLSAAYSKLTGDSTLMGMLAVPLIGTAAIFDFGAVPAGQPFPYVTLGDFDEKPDNAFGTRGYLSIQKLHIWDSAFGGFQKSQLILARLNTLLDQQILTLATQKHVYTLYQQAIPMNDPGEQKILNTSVEYEVFTQEQ